MTKGTQCRECSSPSTTCAEHHAEPLFQSQSNSQLSPKAGDTRGLPLGDTQWVGQSTGSCLIKGGHCRCLCTVDTTLMATVKQPFCRLHSSVSQTALWERLVHDCTCSLGVLWAGQWSSSSRGPCPHPSLVILRLKWQRPVAGWAAISNYSSTLSGSVLLESLLLFSLAIHSQSCPLWDTLLSQQ